MGNRIFRGVVTMIAAAIALLVIAIGAVLVWKALPALKSMGFGFVLNSVWNPVTEHYGILPLLFGTVVSSLLALIVAAPVGLGMAIFLTEIAPYQIAVVVKFLVDFFAAIPSVIVGLWGVFFLVPFLRTCVEPWVQAQWGILPVFHGPLYGFGMLAAILIVVIMILPMITAACCDVLGAVPKEQREAAAALGATRYEVIRLAVLRTARSGIIGAIVLGAGRAMGETVAVMMVIGNRPRISASLFAPAQTLSSMIANEFIEVSTDMHASALIAVALVLFVSSLVVSGFRRVLSS